MQGGCQRQKQKSEEKGHSGRYNNHLISNSIKMLLVMSLKSVLEQMDQRELKFCSDLLVRNLQRWLPRKDFTTCKKMVTAFSFCFQEHYKIKENTIVKCIKEIFCVSAYHNHKNPIKKHFLVCQ